jgi:2-polyprenyl-6-methoxyphenol hydroxylase-like FAD-dependent oxidoreductase
MCSLSWSSQGDCNQAPRVVIVGGGFGGLYAARALRGAAVNPKLLGGKWAQLEPSFARSKTGV